jgi:Ca-activated chloride channel family protein
MRLAHPQLLWLLLLVPAAVLAYAIAFVARRRSLARLGNPTLIERMSSATSVPRKVARATLLCLTVGLLGLALARPQAGGRARLEKQRGLDIVVALDFSKSMLARDIYPSRIERAKRELEQLMDHLNGDRVGLVAFAGETLTYPPTTDYDALKLFWRDLTPADMPVGGTAIGRAMTSAIEMLSRLRAKGGATRDQVILLLTDGEDTESKPLQVAAEAAKLGIKVFAVGIGSRSGELVPEMGDGDQANGYLKDREGKYVTSRLDEDLLAQIAAKTGGGYLRADAKHFGVEAIEAALARLKRTENDTRLVKQYDEVYEYLLLPALLLLLVEACMGERRRGPVGAQALVVLATLVPFLGAWNPLERHNPATESGNASMKSGKAEDALVQYDKAVSELPGDAAAHFNRGNALYALSRYEEAGQEFLRATQASAPSLKSAAFYNLGNTHFQNNKYEDAIAAYRRALALNPANANAKWNLELALQKKKEEDKKKEDQKKDQDKKDQNQQDKQDKQDKKDQQDQKQDQDKKDQNQQDKQDKQDKKDQQDQKQDQDKKDQDQNKQQGKQDQEKKQEEQQTPPQDKQQPAQQQLQGKDDKSPDMREIDAVLDNLEQSPKDLEKMRARLRAVRRAPPAKDW